MFASEWQNGQFSYLSELLLFHRSELRSDPCMNHFWTLYMCCQPAMNIQSVFHWFPAICSPSRDQSLRLSLGTLCKSGAFPRWLQNFGSCMGHIEGFQHAEKLWKYSYDALLSSDQVSGAWVLCEASCMNWNLVQSMSFNEIRWNPRVSPLAVHNRRCRKQLSVYKTSPHVWHWNERPALLGQKEHSSQTGADNDRKIMFLIFSLRERDASGICGLQSKSKNHVLFGWWDGEMHANLRIYDFYFVYIYLYIPQNDDT